MNMRFLIGFMLDILPIIAGLVIFSLSKDFWIKTAINKRCLYTKAQRQHRSEHLSLAWLTAFLVGMYITACAVVLYKDAATGFLISSQDISFRLLALFPFAPLALMLRHITKEEGGELSYYRGVEDIHEGGLNGRAKQLGSKSKVRT